MAAALLARLLAHRAVLVKDQGLPARGEGAHARGVRGSADGRPWLSDEGGHPRVVQALRLLVSTRVKDALELSN